MRQRRGRAGSAESPDKSGSGKKKRPRSRSDADGASKTSSRRRFAFSTSIWSSLIVFAVAVMLRAIHLEQMHRYVHFQHPVLDAEFFDSWGQRIAAGDWFGKEIFFVDPLYAYFLGVVYKIFGHSLDAVRIIQMVIGGLSAVMIQRLGIRLLGGAAGLVCGLIAACYRPFIFYDALLLKAVLKVPLTTLFLFFAVGFFEKPKNRYEPLLAGIFLGLATLARGNLLVMLPVTVLAFLFLGKAKAPARGAAVLLFLFGAALVIAPVAWRNHKVGGEWVLTASGMGQNLYIGNHPGNTSGAYVGPPFTRPNPDYEEGDYRAEALRLTGRKSMTPSEISRFWVKRTLEVIADNPWRWIGLEAKKVWLLTHAVEIPDNYSFDFESRYSWVLRLPFPAFAIIFPLALAGIIAVWREKKRIGLRFLAIFVTVYAISLLPFFIISRYKIPMVPALIVLAVAGIGALALAWRRGEWKRAGLMTALVLGVGFYTRQNPGWIPVSEIHFNFGTEFKTKGLLDAAEEQFREAIRLDPSYAEAYNNLGTVVAAEGRPDEAARLFETARRLKPDYWEADYNRADMAYRAGRYEEAAGILEPLIAKHPDSYEVTLMLGLTRRRAGRTDEALALYRKAEALRPAAIEAPYNEAMLLIDLGRSAEARTVLEALARAHPEHEATRKALAGLK